MKGKLPEDVKQSCLWLVRGYRRRVREYHRKRLDILCSSGSPDGQPGGGGPGNPTARKAEQLERLEREPETQRMRVVERAKLQIGQDIQSEEVRQRLTDSILLNCESGRRYPFEVLNLTEFSRMDFYRRRQRFLETLAEYEEFL